MIETDIHLYRKQAVSISGEKEINIGFSRINSFIMLFSISDEYHCNYHKSVYVTYKIVVDYMQYMKSVKDISRPTAIQHNLKVQNGLNILNSHCIQKPIYL